MTKAEILKPYIIYIIYKYYILKLYIIYNTSHSVTFPDIFATSRKYRICTTCIKTCDHII